MADRADGLYDGLLGARHAIENIHGTVAVAVAIVIAIIPFVGTVAFATSLNDSRAAGRRDE